MSDVSLDPPVLQVWARLETADLRQHPGPGAGACERKPWCSVALVAVEVAGMCIISSMTNDVEQLRGEVERLVYSLG